MICIKDFMQTHILRRLMKSKAEKRGLKILSKMIGIGRMTKNDSIYKTSGIGRFKVAEEMKNRALTCKFILSTFNLHIYLNSKNTFQFPKP